MKTNPTATRIIAGVLPAMALFATTAFAQDTIQTQTTPPPVPTSSAPVEAAPAAAPAAAAAGPSSEDQARYQASLDAATRKAAASSAASPARAARPAAARPAPQRAAVAAPVPIAAAPAPAPVEAAAPVAAAAVPAAAPVTQPAPAEPAAVTETTTQTTSKGTPTWLWLIGGLVALAAIAFGVFAMRRRREDAYTEEWVGEPVAVVGAEPSIAAPLVDEPIVEHADVVTAEDADVAAMTDAAAPVAGRPWIELSLRPIRAGATEESALVDLELTLANAGEVNAKNVRVSTFMLGDAADAPTNMDRLLATSRHGADVDAGDIGAGEGSRIDARVAVPREEMDGATFQPLVGVDVRYTLPDGKEGRTTAAFTVGVHDDTEDPTPLRLGGDIREDVSATLHGIPERV